MHYIHFDACQPIPKESWRGFLDRVHPTTRRRILCHLGVGGFTEVRVELEEGDYERVAERLAQMGRVREITEQEFEHSVPNEFVI